MHRGFITLHRKIVDWEWYSDANVFRVFTHLILTANWVPKHWKGVPVNRGQKVTSIQHIAEETGLTQQCVRTAIKKLKLTGELTTKSTNKYTLVTLTNYEFYQDKEKQLTSKLTSEVTNEQQTTNKQLTTTKPLKQLNNEIIKENNGADESTDDCFDEFWKLYPKKTDRKKAKDKFVRILKSKTGVFDEVMSGLERYLAYDPAVLKGFVKNATTWLNGECWHNEYPEAESEIVSTPGPTAEELAAMDARCDPEQLRKQDEEYQIYLRSKKEQGNKT